MEKTFFFIPYALVAQLDRVTGYEPVGQGFESLQARQKKKQLLITKVASFFIHCESNGISSRFSVYIITEGVYHQPQVVSLSQ